MSSTTQPINIPISNQFSKSTYNNYITIPNEVEEDDEEEDDKQIKDTDAILLATRTEDDFSSLEVYVYDEETGNLYVHHDITLSALGGITRVNSPALSFENAFALNPADLSAVLPKLLLLLVIDISAPSSAVKCAEYPTANTETA